MFVTSRKRQSTAVDRKAPHRPTMDGVLDLIVEPRSVGKAKSGYHSMQGGGGMPTCCESGGNPK
jgi:hypothetical protein